jgi:hypothetical protein
MFADKRQKILELSGSQTTPGSRHAKSSARAQAAVNRRCFARER